MLDRQRRSSSEVGKFFNEFNEPLIIEVSDKALLLLRFWLTYAQTQPLKIEDTDPLLKIIRLCVQDYTSQQIVQKLSAFGIDVPDSFIDRVYIRIKRLIMIILKDEYSDLDLVVPEFELKEEEARVYGIYKAFSELSWRIAVLIGHNRHFAELAAYNPFYTDFLQLFSSGTNVTTAFENDGLEMNSSKRQSISESIISAIVRKNFTKSLYKEVQAWAVLSMFPHIIESEIFVAAIKKSLLLYVEGDSTTLPRVTEVRRFLEFIVVYLFPSQISSADFYNMTVKQRTSALKPFLEDPIKLKEIVNYLENLIWYYSKTGDFDSFVNAVKRPELMYSKKYIMSTFSASIALVFSCILITTYTDFNTLSEQEFINWISRNRNSECSSILKIVAGVES